jgi:putative ABC transport system permease protein
MLFNLNFKIALRNLWRNKISSFINIGGLALGLSSCLLLILYAGYEWGYDKQFKAGDRIYQAMVNVYDVNGEITRSHGFTQNVLAATLKNDFPGVEYVSRTTEPYLRLASTGRNSLKFESRYADPDFLKILDYEFISGNPEKALATPNAVVLTEKTAIRLFGTTDVLNKGLKFENQVDLKITGIIKDLPANVSFPFEMLVPWTVYEKLNSWVARPAWGNHDFITLLQLDETADAALLNIKLKGLVKENMPDAKEEIFVYPLQRLHLYGDFVKGINSGGKIQQVQIFVGLALGILLIACINFMNLATARSQRRAKEIGIKKTIGATRTSLIFQFMLESMIMTSIAIIISIAVVELTLPWFNRLLDIKIVIDYLNPVN